MYVPARFEMQQTTALHALARAHPLATVITSSADGVNANHVPLLLSTESGSTVLRGHIAVDNAMWRDAESNPSALAIFHGPQTYISPSWHPTKTTDGKVVPTWNYAVVHAYGQMRIVRDPAWLRAQLDALTQFFEESVRADWRIGDAPPDYIDKLFERIVGVEIAVDKLVGKWKTTVMQPAENFSNVVDQLRASGQRDAHAMAELMLRR